MKTRLFTWAFTFRWPPSWPFGRFWATEGDAEAEIRENERALAQAADTITRLKKSQAAQREADAYRQVRETEGRM